MTKNHTWVVTLFLIALIGGTGCVTQSTTNHISRAQHIAHNAIIVDGHIDVPYRVNKQWVDVTQATSDGDFDYPRALQGGLNAPFMSIYVPASLDNSTASIQLANTLIDSVEAIVARAPSKFASARTVADVSTYPNLVQGLLDRGYSENEIRGILGLNFLRVWEQVEQLAPIQSN